MVSSPCCSREASRWVLQMMYHKRVFFIYKRTDLETNSDTLSFKDSARWSLIAAGVLPFADADPLTTGCPLDWPLVGGAFCLKLNVPSMIPSKSNGTGGVLDLHISDIARRLRMSVLKIWASRLSKISECEKQQTFSNTNLEAAAFASEGVLKAFRTAWNACACSRRVAISCASRQSMICSSWGEWYTNHFHPASPRRPIHHSHLHLRRRAD